MPLIETFIATAFGFQVWLDNGCLYKFYRFENSAVVYVCDELFGYVVDGQWINP